MSFEEELEAQAMSKYPFEVQLRPSIKEIYLEGANFAKDYYVKELAKRDEIIKVAVEALEYYANNSGVVDFGPGIGIKPALGYGPYRAKETLTKIEALSKGEVR